MQILHGNASKTPRIFSSVRRSQNLQVCRKTIRSGKAGRSVFRRAWNSYKSVLQRSARSSGKRRNARIRSAAFFRKLYRLERFSDEPDWNTLLGKKPAYMTKAGPPLLDRKKLALEYLLHVLEKNTFYSVPITQPSYDVVGDDSDSGVHDSFFQILDIRARQHRPKLVPTLLNRTFMCCDIGRQFKGSIHLLRSTSQHDLFPSLETNRLATNRLASNRLATRRATLTHAD